LLSFPLFNLPGGDIRQGRIAEELRELVDDVLLFLPIAPLAGRELFVALGQLRERHRLAQLLQIEMALRRVAQARFKRVLGISRVNPRDFRLTRSLLSVPSTW
jgi:hypothetical protein